MMYCRKCGAENRDEAVYCRSCGEKLVNTIQLDKKPERPSQPVNMQQVQTQPASYTDPTRNEPIDKKKIGILVAIVAAIAVVIGAGWFIFTLPPRIAFADYVEVSTSGYSPDGQAYAYINWEEIQAKYGDKLKFANNVRANYGINPLYDDPITYMEDMVTVELDQSEGIANGDELSYTVVVDEEVSDVVKVRVNDGQGTYVVEGLDTYVEKLEDISDSDLEKFKLAAQTHFEDGDYAYGWSADTEVESFDYIGSELLTLKDPSVNPNDNPYNRLYMVFKTIAHYSSSSSSETYEGYVTYYWYGCFENVAIDEDGNCLTDLNDSVMTVTNEAFEIEDPNSWRSWTYYGFKTLDELDEETQKNTYYNVESTVDPDAGAKTKNSATTTSEGDEVIGKVTVNVNKLRIRSIASTSGTNLGYAQNGKTYNVYEKTSGGGYTWYRIGDGQWIADNGSWLTYKAN